MGMGVLEEEEGQGAGGRGQGAGGREEAVRGGSRSSIACAPLLTTRERPGPGSVCFGLVKGGGEGREGSQEVLRIGRAGTEGARCCFPPIKELRCSQAPAAAVASAHREVVALLGKLHLLSMCNGVEKRADAVQKAPGERKQRTRHPSLDQPHPPRAPSQCRWQLP